MIILNHSLPLRSPHCASTRWCTIPRLGVSNRPLKPCARRASPRRALSFPTSIGAANPTLWLFLTCPSRFVVCSRTRTGREGVGGQARQLPDHALARLYRQYVRAPYKFILQAIMNRNRRMDRNECTEIRLAKKMTTPHSVV